MTCNFQNSMCGGVSSNYLRGGTVSDVQGTMGPDFVRNILSDEGFSRSGFPGEAGESLTGPDPNDYPVNVYSNFQSGKFYA